MSKNLDFSLRLKFRNEAAGAFAKFQRDMQSSMQRSAQTVTALTSSYGKYDIAVKQTVLTTQRLGVQTDLNAERNLRNLRTVQALARAIDEQARSQTEAGSAAARATPDMERMNQALRDMARQADDSTVRSRNLLGVLRQLATVRLPAAVGKVAGAAGVAAGGVGSALSAFGVATAATKVAGYVVARPMKGASDYSDALAETSNVIYSDNSVQGRITNKQLIDQSVRQASRFGGSREENLAALQFLASTGKLTPEQVLQIMPEVSRVATASGGDRQVLANLAIKATTDFGIPFDQRQKVWNAGLIAGNLGSFELKDMAMHLPEQFSLAQPGGFSGLSGYYKLLELNEAAMSTAGTPDEAATNVKGFLQALNDKPTIMQMRRHGIDWTQTLIAAKEHGQTSVDALDAVVTRLMKENPQYNAVRKRIASAGSDKEKEQLYHEEFNILQGSAVSEILGRRESLAMYVGYKKNRESSSSMDKVFHSDEKDNKTIQGNYDVRSKESAFKYQRAGSAQDFVDYDSFKGLNERASEAADKLADLARVHPRLAAAANDARYALELLAGAGVFLAGLRFLKGGAGAVVGEAAAGVAEGVAGGTAAGLGARVAGGALLARLALGTPVLTLLAQGSAAAVSTAAAGVGIAGAGGYGVGSLINYGIKNTAFDDALGSMLAHAMSLFSKEAANAIHIDVNLDGKQIANSVNVTNGRASKRQ